MNIKDTEQLSENISSQTRLYDCMDGFFNESFNLLKEFYPSARPSSTGGGGAISMRLKDLFLGFEHKDILDLMEIGEENLQQVVNDFFQSTHDNLNTSDRKEEDSKNLLGYILFEYKEDIHAEQFGIAELFGLKLLKFIKKFENEQKFNKWKNYILSKNKELEERQQGVRDRLNNTL